MTIKIQFETEPCTRCSGTGEYSSCAMYGKTCFKCSGRKVQLTRRGTAARKAYDVVMARMEKTWAEVKPGDRVYARGAGEASALRWLTVESIEESTPTRSRVGGEGAPWIETPTVAVDYVESNWSYIPHATSAVRVWDAEIHRAAAVRVEHLAGATVTGL